MRENLAILVLIASIVGMVYFTLIAFDSEAERYFENKANATTCI